MKYEKPALTFEQQAQLLISRGLIVDDPRRLVKFLSNVNYYRLSGYWYAFKVVDAQTGDEKFRPGTTFQNIRDLYEFDRKLRLLLMDSLERIEVAIFRTQLVEANTSLYGPFGYIVPKNYDPKFPPENVARLLTDVADDEGRSHEEFIKRYRTKYASEQCLPLWMAAELMSFGQLLTLYKNQQLFVKQALSHRYGVFPMVLDSWLLTLNALRNSCAHHNRLWNRPLPLVLRFPQRKHDPRWYTPVPMTNHRLYAALTIIHYLLKRIAPEIHWKDSVAALLEAFPTVPREPMGIPIDWQGSPLWE